MREFESNRVCLSLIVRISHHVTRGFLVLYIVNACTHFTTIGFNIGWFGISLTRSPFMYTSRRLTTKGGEKCGLNSEVAFDSRKLLFSTGLIQN